MTKSEVKYRKKNLWLASLLAAVITVFGVTTSDTDLQSWVIVLQILCGIGLIARS